MDKSTFLKTLNRMNDLVENVRITGEVKYDGKDIFSSNANVNELRKEDRNGISETESISDEHL